MPFKIRISFVLFLLLITSCSKNSRSEADKNNTRTPDETGYIVKVGDTAPDFVSYLVTGEQLQLTALRGGVVMLQFTASWCKVCREEMPAIEAEIWQKYKKNPKFSLYAIDLKEPVETILPFIKSTKITYPVLTDPEGRIFKLYAQEDAGVTRNVIIDKDGKIAMLTRLYDKDEFNKMVQCIDSLIRR
jgi:peroxiredoxin